MAKAKRKTLPTNFTEILKTGSFEDQKAVFDSCALDAYERGYSHDTALHQYAIKEELTRYLVAEGLNINTQNAYGRTPLYTHSTVGAPLVAVLLELGADVNLANNDGCTPLFTALANARKDTVKLLLEHGADIKHKNQAKQNALEYGLSLTANASIPDMLQCAKLMLDAGTKVTKNMQKCVKAIGDNFERYREAFNKDLLATTDTALTDLYKLFDVEPAAKHITHNGTQSITITGNTPQEQFNNLWDLLVPPQGPAKTVQGEVIRIAGRVRSEFYHNGGANWDRQYRAMLNALIKHLGSQNALSDDDLARAKEIAHAINGKGDFDEDILDELAQLALTWVSHNLDPIALKTPAYKR